MQSGIARQSYHPDEPLQVVFEHANGSRWVRLTAPACDREAALMRHCVSQEIYKLDVWTGEVALFSLRDRRNRPHVTVEFDNGGLRLAQVKGKANSAPGKYRQAICEFLNTKYRQECFALGVEAITDLLAVHILFDGRNFAVPSRKFDMHRTARAYLDRVWF